MEVAFGNRVRNGRVALGLGLGSVARRCHIAKGYLSMIETRKVAPPSWKVTRRLAKVLNLDETEMLILGWAEKSPKPIRDEVLSRLHANGRR